MCILTSPSSVSGAHQYLRMTVLSTTCWWLRWWRICLQCRRPGFDPWVGKVPWRRAWQPTPVFLVGESPGTEELAGYNPWGCKESDTTERLNWTEVNWSSYSLITNYHNQWLHYVLCFVAQLCLTLCDPMDYSLPGFSVHGEFSRQESSSGLPCPPPGDLTNPGIKPRSPALQTDSLSSEPPGKPNAAF